MTQPMLTAAFAPTSSALARFARRRPRATRRAQVALTACIGALLLLAGSADAQRKVFLNGVDLSSVEVKGTKLPNCDVRFDGAGDVFITCKGVKIGTEPADGANRGKAKPAPKQAPAPTTGPLTGRYFLVAKAAKDGASAPFKISVYLNRKLVRLVSPARDLQVYEITDHLRRGRNSVRMVAARDLSVLHRKGSRSPNDRLELIIGRGTMREGMVVIQDTLITYSRNASETRGFDDSFSLRAR